MFGPLGAWLLQLEELVDVQIAAVGNRRIHGPQITLRTRSPLARFVGLAAFGGSWDSALRASEIYCFDLVLLIKPLSGAATARTRVSNSTYVASLM